MEFYNSDGSASGACGNGTRCVADLLSKESGKKEITLLTASGSLKSKILESNLVETEIGVPKVNWQEIPLSKQLDTPDLKIEIVDKKNYVWITYIYGCSTNMLSIFSVYNFNF